MGVEKNFWFFSIAPGLLGGLDIGLLELTTRKPIEEILRICFLPKAEFNAFLEDLKPTLKRKEEDRIFKIDPKLPFSTEEYEDFSILESLDQ